MSDPVKKNAEVNSDFKNYYLFAFDIQFIATDIPEKDRQLLHAKLNTLVINDNASIDLATLGRAQESVQQQLIARMMDQGTKIQVVNITTLNIMHLGYFTKEDFEKGMNFKAEPDA